MAVGKDYHRAYYAANREKLLARMKAFRDANPDKEEHRRAVAAVYRAPSKEKTAARRAAAAAEKAKAAEAKAAAKAAARVRAKEANKARLAAWNSANPERVKAKNAAWAAANRERRNATAAAWRAANPDRARAAQDRYVTESRDKVRAKGEAYRARNMPKFAAKESKRRATKKGATPQWLTPAQHSEMLRIYTLAAALDCHVDHIVPLQGKTVCGLHVPWNLQLLTPEENHAKINHLLPDHVYRAPPIPPPANGGRRGTVH